MTGTGTSVADAPADRCRPWRRIWIGLAIAMGALLLAFGAYALCISAMVSSFSTPYDGRDRIAFSKEAWDAAAHDWKGARFLMVDDLIAKHELVGMRTQAVIGLLGPFHATDYPGFDYCYFLGPEDHPFAIDNAWLVLTIADGVVTKWEVLTD